MTKAKGNDRISRLEVLVERMTAIAPGKTKRKNRKAKLARSSVVTAPVVGSAIIRSRVPRVLNSREGVVVSNTERFSILTTAVGATTFSRIDITPSNVLWLNGVAINYSKYRWISVQMYYIPIVPTTQTGLMAMGFVYDVNDSMTGTTVGIVQQMYGAVSGPIWAGYEGGSGLNTPGTKVPTGALCITLDTGRLDKSYYKYATVAQIGAMSGPEAAMYVPASVVWATDSAAVTQGGAGQIMAKYTVELLEPVPATLND